MGCIWNKKFRWISWFICSNVADVYEKFRDKCIEIYGLDPSYFLSAPGLAWKACLNKTNVNLELVTDVDMLLMTESGIRGGICQSIQRYAKANDKSMNNCDKALNHHI